MKHESAEIESLTVESVPIDALIPYARNARTHSDEQIAQIAGSLREFGWTNPVLIDGERGIIAGHGRVLAARKLELEFVPCISLAHLSDAQRRAYVLADNKLAERAGWDSELLALEVAELSQIGVEMSALGFTQKELSDMFADPVSEPTPPDGFAGYDESIEVEHQCPKCGYVWSGKHSVHGDAES